MANTNNNKRAAWCFKWQCIQGIIERWQAYEKQLNGQQRKRQWGLVMSLLVMLFMASFLWSPWQSIEGLRGEAWQWSGAESVQAAKGKNFEMPVDSFEWYLKNDLHERLSEKE